MLAQGPNAVCLAATVSRRARVTDTSAALVDSWTYATQGRPGRTLPPWTHPGRAAFRETTAQGPRRAQTVPRSEAHGARASVVRCTGMSPRGRHTLAGRARPPIDRGVTLFESVGAMRRLRCAGGDAHAATCAHRESSRFDRGSPSPDAARRDSRRGPGNGGATVVAAQLSRSGHPDLPGIGRAAMSSRWRKLLPVAQAERSLFLIREGKLRATLVRVAAER